MEPEQQHLDTKTVRDIVEHEPERVNEVWCRKIFRQLLQSLELQYAMQMPHRAITADTVAFHSNGEPLLLPSIVSDPEPEVGGDLTSLAKLIHYAITQELVPTGPLRGRAPAGYSDALVNAVDRCMDPDPAARPRSIDELRDILGIVPLSAVPVAPMPPLHASAPDPVVPDATGPNTAGPDTPVLDVSTPDVPAADIPVSDVLVPNIPVPDIPAPDIPAPDVLVQDIPAPRAHAKETQATETPATDAPATEAPVPDVTARAAPAPAVHTPSVAVPAAAAMPSRAGKPAQPAPEPARRARWPLIAGIVILAAFIFAGLALLRDGGSFDHAALALPQHAEGAAPSEAPATPPAPVDAAPAAPIDTGAVPAADAAMPAAAPGQPLPQAAPAPAGATTVYKLQIQPWGTVYVDNVDRGVSPPVKRLLLSPGRHLIRVSNPNFQERVLEVDTATGPGLIEVDFREKDQ